MAFSRLRSRLLGLFAFWLVLLAILGGLAAARLQSMTDTLDSVYRDRLVCQVLLRSVGDAYRLRIAGAAGRFADGLIDAPAALAQIADAQRQAAHDWILYRHTTLVAAEQRGIVQAEPLLQAADAAAEEARRLIAAADRPGLAAWRRGAAPLAFDPLGAVIDRLFTLQATVAEKDVSQARAARRATFGDLFLLLALGLALGGAGTWALVVRYTAAARDSERALRRMNAFYTALSRTNHLIVRAADADTLLRELCRICTESGHALITAVFRVEGGQATRFAFDGPAAGFFDELPPTWDVTAPEFRQSVTAIALSTGRHGVGRIAPRPGQPAWSQNAQRLGIRSIAAFPLMRGGQIHGSLSLYAAEPDFFDGALVSLLVEMAGDVSFALDNLDREAARVRLQQQTQRDLERFQTLFRAAPMACVITSLADLRVLEVNDVMCERFGLVRDEIVGKQVERLGSLLEEEDAREYRERLTRDGRVRNLEARTRTAGGGTAVSLVNAEKIDYNGQPCVMAMALDITDLRAAAAAEQARAAAEAANREKTAFLAQMSHELRTPLNAMLGFTQLMQRDARTRLLRQDIEQLEHIRQAGWHLLSLVNDVMDVSRIESGQFAVNVAAVDVGEALDEALRLAEESARVAGVRIEAAHRGRAPAGVLADPVRLRQVFINLLSNAVKYNRPGGSVDVRLHAAADRVVIEVADTGIGMSELQLQRLYEPFNRLGRERSGIEGTGLGLALTRQLVSLMGGELGIESRPGVGTTARVGLRAAALEEGAVVSGFGAIGDGEPRGSVLYIEDNEINVMLIEQMLSRWPGVRFSHAPSGQAGIDLAAQLQPDLVLMDMQLPDMDGIEILRRLRADGATAGLRVVALSASASPQSVARALENGAVDYWTKPVDLSHFLRDMSRNLAAAALDDAMR